MLSHFAYPLIDRLVSYFSGKQLICCLQFLLVCLSVEGGVLPVAWVGWCFGRGGTGTVCCRMYGTSGDGTLVACFPGGSVARKLPGSARDMGLVPGRGRSHMPQGIWARAPHLLSLCSGARELVLSDKRHRCSESCCSETLL